LGAQDALSPDGQLRTTVAWKGVCLAIEGGLPLGRASKQPTAKLRTAGSASSASPPACGFTLSSSCSNYGGVQMRGCVIRVEPRPNNSARQASAMRSCVTGRYTRLSIAIHPNHHAVRPSSPHIYVYVSYLHAGIEAIVLAILLGQQHHLHTSIRCNGASPAASSNGVSCLPVRWHADTTSTATAKNRCWP